MLGPASCCCWKMWFCLIKPRNGSVITEKHSGSFHVLRCTSRSNGTRLWIFIEPNMPALLKQVLQNAKECLISQLFCGKIVGTSMYKTTEKLTEGLLYFTKWYFVKRSEIKSVLCEMKSVLCSLWNESVLCEMKICTLRNGNLYFAKWKSVLCEMKICSLLSNYFTKNFCEEAVTQCSSR